MKKLLFALIILALGCKKATIQPVQSYLIGRWINTLTVDTIYSGGTKVWTYEPNQADLLFYADRVVKNDDAYNYTGLIDFKNGQLFTLTKIDDSHIRLDWKHINSWTVEYYSK